MNTFFTADTHFGHDNIVPMCGRPFMDASDIAAWNAHKQAKETIPGDLKIRLESAGRRMDEEMILRWNKIVKQDDHVWHLGDFHKSNKSRPADYMGRLNGRKHLIRGNHDSDATWAHPAWIFSRHYAELRLDKTDLVLFHYAMRVWNGSFHGKTIQLFGHSHGMLNAMPMQCDVGVDCWDFRPIVLDEIKERIRFNAG